jgi:hypothetical protein
MQEQTPVARLLIYEFRFLSVRFPLGRHVELSAT